MELEGYGHEKPARDILKAVYEVCAYQLKVLKTSCKADGLQEQVPVILPSVPEQLLRAHIDLVNCKNMFLESSIKYQIRSRPPVE